MKNLRKNCQAKESFRQKKKKKKKTGKKNSNKEYELWNADNEILSWLVFKM